MPAPCRGASKGTYVFESLPVTNTGKTRNSRPPIELLPTPSGEYGPEVLASLRQPDRQAAVERCQQLRNSFARQRAAKSRHFMQNYAQDPILGKGIGSGDSNLQNMLGLKNRNSIPVQTGLYLEELTEAIEQDDFATQTDDFLDRPPTPMFVPAKTGMDVATQIYDGDLFDFNLEVRPILEVLIGKTIEQALLEVLEEEELAELRKQQERYEEVYNSAMAEIARLEDRDRRYREEKERRKVQNTLAQKIAEETKRKIAAQTFARVYLAPLLPNVYEQLLARGYFYDAVEKDIEVNFMEPLLNKVVNSLDSERRARIVLDGLIRTVVDMRHQAFRDLGRSIAEDEVIVQCVPELMNQTSSNTIDRLNRLAVQRLELAKQGVGDLVTLVAGEAITQAVDDVSVEVQAQKEAEAAADDTDSNY